MLVSWGYNFNEQEVDLSNLNIGSIESNFLCSNFKNLKKLTLKNNKILRLYPNTFRECKQLVFLDLSYNRLTQLSKGDFDGAENLQTLYVNNNIIEHINADTFFNLIHIKTYSFASNPVSNLYNLVLQNGVLSSTWTGGK
jgi:Leucine-rich repeat (LRR) protein